MGLVGIDTLYHTGKTVTNTENTAQNMYQGYLTYHWSYQW